MSLIEKEIIYNRTLLFNEQQIGKATINVPTEEKDESKKKIQTTEKTLNEDQEIKK